MVRWKQYRYNKSSREWDYQQAALRHALIALWLYYDGEDDEGGAAPRKARFFRRYRDNDIPLPAHLNVGKKRDHIKLLAPYYTLTPAAGGEQQLDYTVLVNRMGFWM